jgi:NAD dependent epimerase/dehydratase
LKTVLITGANGFIGSHLTEAAARAGYQVRALVHYNSLGSWGWLDRCAQDVRGAFEVVAGDVRDPYGVREAMRGCDAVLHLAALIGIPYSYIAPEAYVETNVRGTLNVLQAARDLGVRKIVHTSTSEVYGTARFVPITEDHPLQGQSPYAATKSGADQLALSFHASFDLPVVVVRPFNTYGPRQSARAVIPTIIAQIAAGAQVVKLGSLHPTRDFNYVTDIVTGFLAALEAERGVGEVINLGSNYEVTIGDTARTISALMNADIEVAVDAERVRPDGSEVERLYAANEKAVTLLGWRPEFGGPEGFRRGLSETIAWFTDGVNQALYRADVYAR